MTQYIDKDNVVAEIEKKIKSINSCPFRTAELGSEKLDEGQLNAYNEIISYLDTLEVKEVNLNEELDEWMKCGPHTSYPWCTIPDAIKITAEHFYELGLNARKEENKEVVSTNINNSNVHLMSELPQAVIQKLFELRGVPAQQELTTYNLIIVDDDIYYTPDEYGKKMLREYFERKDSFHAAAIPHAIIKNGYIVKNRYGYVDTN